MPKTHWWRNADGERFWLKTTDRSNVGVDLNAPALDDAGNRHAAYALITCVEASDVVLHYEKPVRAITSWSRAVGRPWMDEVVWAAHGTVARAAGIEPYRREGWRVGLEGPYRLERPVELEDLRRRQEELAEIRDALLSTHGKPIYFPFELSSKRPLRPTQFYLTKVPLGVVRLFKELDQRSASRGDGTQDTPSDGTLEKPVHVPERGGSTVGQEYREVDEDIATATRDPFSVDPSVVDRGLRGHASTLNALSRAVRSHGWTPLQPLPDDPQFDLAWEMPDALCVAEVKSLTVANSEKQLRLGLGQVLRYRHLLGRRQAVRAFLVVEQQPLDPSWHDLCSALGVVLVWPDVLPRGLTTPAP